MNKLVLVTDVEQRGEYAGECIGQVEISFDKGGCLSSFNFPCGTVERAAKVVAKLEKMTDSQVVEWLNEEQDWQEMDLWLAQAAAVKEGANG